MINKSIFTPYHINAHEEDLLGNEGIGRYILLPGSDGRAFEIAQRFENVKMKKHPRGHNLYMGEIKHKGQSIDLAVVATGMGCPSLEIIMHELYSIGGKRFLRVGTAGTLQPEFLKIGDLVNVQAAVRDENTSSDYMPFEVPAIASYEVLTAINETAKRCLPSKTIATGIVHCKNSFYAREFGVGPKGEKNLEYMNLLKRCGVLATEMETSALFTQAQFYNYEQSHLGAEKKNQILAGAVLGILADPPHYFAEGAVAAQTVESLINFSLETIITLAANER